MTWLKRHNGWLHPRRDCVKATFTNQLTPKRVEEPPTSRASSVG
jgi:hypothetical protein